MSDQDPGPSESQTLQHGKYKVLEPIAGGAFGVVSRGLQLMDGEVLGPVAIKIARETGGLDLARFRKEARALRTVTHPNLVALHDAFVEGDAQVLVMAYLEGTSLGHFLMARPLDVHETVRICAQIGSALQALNAKGVVHGDLSPNNVIVRPWIDEREPFVSLIDLGAACMWRPGVGYEADAWTPGFAAPEVMLGRPTERSDIFSLGALAFAMLTRALPYPADVSRDPEALLRASPPELPSFVPPELASVLRRALEPDEQKRYPGYLFKYIPHLVHGTAAFEGDQDVGAPPSTDPLAVARDQKQLLTAAKNAFIDAGLSQSGEQYRRAAELFDQAAKLGPLPASAEKMADKARRYAARYT